METIVRVANRHLSLRQPNAACHAAIVKYGKIISALVTGTAPKQFRAFTHKHQSESSGRSLFVKESTVVFTQQTLPDAKIADTGYITFIL